MFVYLQMRNSDQMITHVVERVSKLVDHSKMLENFDQSAPKLPEAQPELVWFACNLR